MKHALRAVGVGVLAAGFSLAVAVILALPAAAGVAEAVRGAQAGSGPVAAWSGVVNEARSGRGVAGAWTSRTVSELAGKTDALLLLVRCPSIVNGSGLVPLLLQPSIRNSTALEGGEAGR